MEFESAVQWNGTTNSQDSQSVSTQHSTQHTQHTPQASGTLLGFASPSLQRAKTFPIAATRRPRRCLSDIDPDPAAASATPDSGGLPPDLREAVERRRVQKKESRSSALAETLKRCTPDTPSTPEPRKIAKVAYESPTRAERFSFTRPSCALADEARDEDDDDMEFSRAAVDQPLDEPTSLSSELAAPPQLSRSSSPAKRDASPVVAARRDLYTTSEEPTSDVAEVPWLSETAVLAAIADAASNSSASASSSSSSSDTVDMQAEPLVTAASTTATNTTTTTTVAPLQLASMRPLPLAAFRWQQLPGRCVALPNATRRQRALDTPTRPPPVQYDTSSHEAPRSSVSDDAAGAAALAQLDNDADLEPRALLERRRLCSPAPRAEQAAAMRRFFATYLAQDTKGGSFKPSAAVPQCECGLAARTRTVRRRTANFGRMFHGCGQRDFRKGCSFFQWREQADEDSGERAARLQQLNEQAREKLACQRGITAQARLDADATPARSANLNRHITEILERMMNKYKNEGDQFHQMGYRKAITSLSACRERITSGKQAAKLYGVGRRIADKIDEICRTGRLRQLDYVLESPDTKALDLFMGVWGAGPKTAAKWVAAGYRSLDDVARHAAVTRQQKIGLLRYHDFKERIPRAEVHEIQRIVGALAVKRNPGFLVMCCGSYRRGKPDCGDVDILITHADGASHRTILKPLLRDLYRQGYLTDSLSMSDVASDTLLVDALEPGSGTQGKYMGVFKLKHEGAKHRRLDIITVPWDQYGCALLYFTGSDWFNRSMRWWAKTNRMTLTQHCVAPAIRTNNGKDKVFVGKPIPCSTEEEVFQILGLRYVEPEARNPV